MLSNQIENEMGRAHTMYEREERCIQDFGRETRARENTWKTWAQMGG
jgi:hypothetical protein